jgi:hypothetical protein
MDNFLIWYHTLSRSRSFRWAKGWGLLLTVLLAAIGYFWLNGQGLEWLLILGLPTIFAASNMFESLARAYRYTAMAQILAPPPAPQTAIAPPEVPQEPQIELQLELTDADRLSLCQYYVFLYLLFQLRKTGEETFNRMVNLPKGRYREWLEGLKAENLELVQSSQGKTSATRVTFEEALKLIAEHDGLTPEIWDFPKEIYEDKRNWRMYNPGEIEIAPGRTIKVQVKGGKGGNAPILLPLYPTRLKDLKIEAKN